MARTKPSSCASHWLNSARTQILTAALRTSSFASTILLFPSRPLTHDTKFSCSSDMCASTCRSKLVTIASFASGVSIHDRVVILRQSPHPMQAQAFRSIKLAFVKRCGQTVLRDWCHGCHLLYASTILLESLVHLFSKQRGLTF